MIKESKSKSVSWSKYVKVRPIPLNEHEIECRKKVKKTSETVVAGVYIKLTETLGKSLLNNQGKVSPMIFSMFITQCDEKLNEHADKMIEQILRQKQRQRQRQRQRQIDESKAPFYKNYFLR